MDSKLLECKICVAEYSVDVPDLNPRILSCGHTICLGCARNIHRRPTKEIKCPFDRTVTQNVKEVNELPRNFLIIEILEEKKNTSSSERDIEEEVTLPPEQCTENGDHVAEWYCDTCNAVFCDSCFATTHAAKVHASHVKIPISEKPYQLPKCSKHPTNKAELVCTENECHPDPFCHTCHVTTHQGHKLEELTDKIEREKNKLCALLSDNTMRKTRLELEMKEIEGVEERLSEHREELVGMAQSVREAFERNLRETLKILEERIDRGKRVARQSWEEKSDKVRRMNTLNVRILNAMASNSGFDFDEIERLTEEVRRTVNSDTSALNHQEDDPM